MLHHLQQVQEAERLFAGGAVRQAQRLVLTLLDRRPIDPRVLELFAKIQRNANDPLSLLEFVTANQDQMPEMPPAALVSVAEALCRAANTPEQCREMARKLLSTVARSDWMITDLPRLGQAFVDARDPEGLRALADNLETRHPDWTGSEPIDRLRRDADALDPRR